jgi:hypothetical protein
MKILLLISGLALVEQCFSQPTTSTIEFDNDIILTGTVEPFIQSKHKYDTCDSGLDWKTICLIDGQIWYGNDLGLTIPKNQLTRLTLRINRNDINLDVSGMFNPNFGGRLTKEQFKLKTTEDGYILYGYFSDGAGTYTTNWRIVKNKSIRQTISRDERDFYWQLEK